MATHRIPILGANTVPDSSGDVFFEPYTVKDTGPAAWDGLVLIFNESGAKDGIRSNFRVPENYVGSAKFLVVWTANATTGNLNMDLSYLNRSGAEDMGAAYESTDDNATSTKSGTAFQRTELTITPTAGDFVAGDECLYELFRDSLDVADTLGSPAIIFGIYFEYSDV